MLALVAVVLVLPGVPLAWDLLCPRLVQGSGLCGSCSLASFSAVSLQHWLEADGLGEGERGT